jgi:hypothetical protein
MDATVSKFGARFLVEGDIWAYSESGRKFGPEPYSSLFRTRSAAMKDVEKLEAFNLAAKETHVTERAYRAERVAAYLETRAARKAATPVQLALAF